jgi:hypothetical protein
VLTVHVPAWTEKVHVPAWTEKTSLPAPHSLSIAADLGNKKINVPFSPNNIRGSVRSANWPMQWGT